MDSAPDLTCNEGTGQHAVDGDEATHNPLAATDGLPACLVVRIVGSWVWAWLACSGLLHSARVSPRPSGGVRRYVRLASSSRTGRAIPLSSCSPNSAKRTPWGGTDSATLWLTNTCPALAWAAIRAARLTVRPK